jgi:nitrite reductase/ring-hydroxylating ferredoxin subunit
MPRHTTRPYIIPPSNSISAPYGQDDVPLPIPDGWYCLALSAELAPGKVVSRRLAGQDVVLYRTRSGLLRATRPYCPHLGAHLGRGKVDGENLVCAFHAFVFAPDGRCAGTGYGTAPPKASLTLLPVQEKNGIIMAWFHHADAPPSWEIPEVPVNEVGHLHSKVWEFPGHPQEICENAIDLGHLKTLHRFASYREASTPVNDGPHHRSAVEVGFRVPGLSGWRTVAYQYQIMLHGLGQITAGITFLRIARLRLWILPTPVDRWRVQMRLVMCARIPEPRLLPPPLGRLYATVISYVLGRISLRIHRTFMESERIGDIPIFSSRAHITRPRLANGDGPITAYRRWARQFYLDSPPPVQDIDSDLTPEESTYPSDLNHTRSLPASPLLRRGSGSRGE